MEKKLSSEFHPLRPCGDAGDCGSCTAGGWCRFAAGETAAFRSEGLSGEIRRGTGFTEYGIAFDLGTTSIVGVLAGPEGIAAEQTAVNPQTAWGADVLTRAQRSTEGLGGTMRDAVQTVLCQMTETLCGAAGIRREQVSAGVITGNTVMLYLLTGRDPACLTQAPFQPDCLFDEMLPLAGIPFYLPPCVSAFIGADALCAFLASDIPEGGEACLLADIGTNGELLLRHEGKLLCCSVAAGPAFEGYGLSHGMPSTKGAIDRACVAGGQIRAHVIGGGEAGGICGSGMIDLIACLRQLGRIGESGDMAAEEWMITPEDVRRIQMAKSAVCAGITALTAARGLPAARIAGLWIAGGFGSSLNPQNAGAIGLIPFNLIGKTRSAGNAALAGALCMLRDPETVRQARRLAGQAEVLDLTSSAVFTERYLKGMRLAPFSL